MLSGVLQYWLAFNCIHNRRLLSVLSNYRVLNSITIDKEVLIWYYIEIVGILPKKCVTFYFRSNATRHDIVLLHMAIEMDLQKKQ